MKSMEDWLIDWLLLFISMGGVLFLALIGALFTGGL